MTSLPAPRSRAAVLLTLLLLVHASPAAAGPPVAPSARTDAILHDTVAAAVEGLRVRGAGAGEVDAMLAERFGWVRVTSDTSVASAFLTSDDSENDDVTMSTPSVYYNTQQGRYEAMATFRWLSCGSYPCYWYESDGGTNLGGYDGFGLSIGKLVTRKTQSFYVYTASGTRTTYTNPWDADDSGATYRNQDKFTCGKGCGYNWDHGLLVYSFGLRSGCPRGNYAVNSKLGHTWDSTSVSGISVTTKGVTISFDKQEHYWQAVNPQQRNWYPCGY
jgi:hypothetical protein